MKKLLFFSLFILLISCSKNKKTVKLLDGDWTVTDIMHNGVSAISSYNETINYSFEKCASVKKGCDGSLTTTDRNGNIDDEGFTYIISEKGTHIKIKFNVLGGFSVIAKREITEQSENKIIWTHNDYIDGIDTKIETFLEKQ